MNDNYLRMIRGEQVDHTPCWFMRQAGRSQAKYREIKKHHSLFEITHIPELCAYVTALPVEEYGVDAAILYKDIMTPLPAIGVDVEIRGGIGPVIEKQVRTMDDVDRMRPLDVEGELPFVLETIRILTKEVLNVPLIGFAGAPFTLASYMIEGGPSKTYNGTRIMMLQSPGLWEALMTKLADMTSVYLKAQVAAGAHALQIFDSWVGAVSPEEYRLFVAPYVKRILEDVKAAYPSVPVTMHAVGAMHILPEWEKLPLDVVGLDWRTPIPMATHMGLTKAVQGNLDPAYLFADWEILRLKIDRILEEGEAYGRHIFNLGHGVLPEVNPDVLKRVVEYVHERTSRG